MITTEKVQAVIDQYERNGWLLRRLGLTNLSNSPTNIDESVSVRSNDLDVAWFSRPPGIGEIAWELRYLGEPPVALVQHIDEASPDRESIIKQTEDRLADMVTNRGRA